jgi:hypothetical protein
VSEIQGTFPRPRDDGPVLACWERRVGRDFKNEYLKNRTLEKRYVEPLEKLALAVKRFPNMPDRSARKFM